MDVKLMLKKWFTTKVGKHIPSGFSVSTISSFKKIENKHDVYRGDNYMNLKFFWIFKAARNDDN